MRKAQYVLGGGESRKCKISYLIEGDASKRQVHGGFIGRATWRKVSVKSNYLLFFLTYYAKIPNHRQLKMLKKMRMT